MNPVFFARLRRSLNQVLEPCLMLLLVSLVCTVLWQVFSRYVTATPSVITDEIARFLLMWTTLPGAAWVVGQNAHLAIDLIQEQLNTSSRFLLHRLICLALITFSTAVLLVGGSHLVSITLTLNQVSTVLNVPMGYVYLALPVSGVLMTVYAVCEMFSPLHGME